MTKSDLALVTAVVLRVIAVLAPQERQPSLEYCGVHDDAREYQRGNFVTRQGSMWHCNVSGTKAKPGDGSSDWTLAVKSGERKVHA